MITDDNEVPLFDPERDLVVLPGAPGHTHPAAGRVVDALEQVRSRILTERLYKVGTLRTGPSSDPYPVMPAVAALHRRAEPALRRRAQTAVACLEQLIQRYPDDPELQDFLDVPPVLHRWILRHPAPEQLRVDFCRLDLLGDTLSSTRVLEFNASSPGGVVSSGMLNRFCRQSSLGTLLAEWEVPQAPFERPGWFADWLIDYGRVRGVREDESSRVGLFHERLSLKFEFNQLRAQLRGRGRTPVETEPSAIDHVKSLRLGYLKYIPEDPREVERWETFCARMTDGQLVAPNALAARWVAENKLCLAALSDPRFRRLFTPPQRATLDALVPYSRKLGDGISETEAINERTRLIIKAPYSRHGTSVVLGAETPADVWSGLVRDPARRGWLIQERVTPSAVGTNDGTYFRDLMVPVLGGRVIGYCARMNRKRVLNSAQGSGTHAVFSPHDLHKT
ncbi:hypothetical protein [Streptomyces gobiensis]|uniref:hypothetical protein n=1 Tax=Streptomyces gobiensis TaxID=2875706 RepID=UPI001E5F9806|nr:hypothetical protein [Streptomyces gobiensis]UGY91887.1 hypothetical protein test1122_09240 [Streptomyces gobiensis]